MVKKIFINKIARREDFECYQHQEFINDFKNADHPDWIIILYVFENHIAPSHKYIQL